MPTIRPTCSNRHHPRARSRGQAAIAVLQPGAEDCEICADAEQLRARLGAEPQAIIVYNQQADAIAPVGRLEVSPAQVFIEIRQDTRGELGLQAYRRQGRAEEALELFHE